MRKRLSTLFAMALALSVALVGIIPSAPAVGPDAALGQVHGVVDTQEDNTLDETCNAPEPGDTGYIFNDVVLNGSFNSAAGAFSGPISTTNVYGFATACVFVAGQKVSGDSGTVASSDSPARLKGSGVGSVSGIFYGTYVRTASFVTVALDVYYILGQNNFENTCVTNRAACTYSRINVRAQFNPDVKANGTYRTATFVGEWGTP